MKFRVIDKGEFPGYTEIDTKWKMEGISWPL